MNKEESQYLDIINKILNEGEFHEDRTGTGTIRTFGEKMEFDLSSNKLPLLTTKKVNSRLIIEELRWFLQGSTDVKKLQNKNVHIWDGNGSKEECSKFDRDEGDLGPIYGHQWRNFGATKRTSPMEQDYWSEANKRFVNRFYYDDGYDQIKYIVESLKNNPNSRRILLSGWNPKEAHIVNPPPCHTIYQFQVTNGKLNGLLFQRSGDLMLGIPFNIASLAIFINLLAKATGLKAGKLVHFIADCHIYKDHLDGAREQIKRDPFEFPSIQIDDSLNNLGLDTLINFRNEDIKIENYNSHGKITLNMSV